MNYMDFLKYMENKEFDKLDMIAKNIESDINESLYRQDSESMSGIYGALQDLRKRLPVIDNYSCYMEKESIYFYSGMIYAYYNMCGMYYTMIRSKKEKEEIKEFNRECYSKLKEYLVGKGRVDEETIERGIGISRNKIMSCVTTLGIVGHTDVDMIKIDNKVYYFLSNQANKKEEIRHKLNNGTGSIKIEFE